jgi:hypothetical protein
MISLLTPTRLEVDHVKKLVFLSRKANSTACSSGLVKMPRQTSLSDTLGSKIIFLKSPSALMAFLNYVRASTLRGHADC